MCYNIKNINLHASTHQKRLTDFATKARKFHTQSNILSYELSTCLFIKFLPSSDVKNEVIVFSPKPCLFPAAMDISYVVCGVRSSNSCLLTLSVVIFRMNEFSFFSSIRNSVRSPSPVLSGFSQDISALLDLMSVTVRFVGLSGNRARKKEIKVCKMYHLHLYKLAGCTRCAREEILLIIRIILVDITIIY